MLMAMLVPPQSADAADALGDVATRARVEAKKWRTDAELVQVEVSLIDFGPGLAPPSPYPPSRAALFSFLSPSARQAMRIIADLNRDTLRVEYLPEPYSPFTLAIPSDLPMNVDAAIAEARRAIATECGSDNPVAVRSCAVVTGAELHMQEGRPIWTIQFGQNPRTFRSVSRAVDARTERVITSQSNPARPDEATGLIPALQATVVGLRFFESAPQRLTRNYDDLFFYNAARYIYWELHLVHPAPSHPTSFTLEEVWKGPGGDIAWRATRQFTVEAGRSSSSVFSGARIVGTKTVSQPNLFYADCLRRQRERGTLEACSPTSGVDIEQWQRGAYEVEIVVDNRVVATGAFNMQAKDDIYAEVRAKAAASGSIPVGFIRDLDAKVAGLKFFEADAAVPPRARPSYTTQFRHADTHKVIWELDLVHPAPRRWLPLPIEALLFFRDAAGERIVQRKVLQSAVPAERTDTAHVDSLGWEDDYYYYRAGAVGTVPRQWMAGAYRLDLWVEGAKVASGTFEIR